jgi:hypothetical protein
MYNKTTLTIKFTNMIVSSYIGGYEQAHSIDQTIQVIATFLSINLVSEIYMS